MQKSLKCLPFKRGRGIMEKNRRMVDGIHNISTLTLGELERIWDWRSSRRFWKSCSWLVLGLRSACIDFTCISNCSIHVMDPSQKICTYVGQVYEIHWILYLKELNTHNMPYLPGEWKHKHERKSTLLCSTANTTIDMPLCQVLEANQRPIFANESHVSCSNMKIYGDTWAFAFTSALCKSPCQLYLWMVRFSCPYSLVCTFNWMIRYHVL